MASNTPVITSGISKLNLQPIGKPAGKNKAGQEKSRKPTAKKAVAESWEDDSLDSDSDGDDRPTTADGDAPVRDGTSAPPPTPVAPTHNMGRPFAASDPSELPGMDQEDDAASGSARRPEKTDAVARRMINSALGLRAPKLTDEQKAYEKAMKEKERKRREQERAAERRKEEEAEKAKAAIWED